MGKHRAFSLLTLISVFLLSGCVVRTYQATRDRVDQDLSSGNRGYLMGQPSGGEEKERKTTRTTQVMEIELRSPLKFEKAKKTSAPVQEVAGQEASSDVMQALPEPASFQEYTVQKNDTLQKISQKFYGTTKKWHKIFEANQGVLRSPDKIRPGQVINIPVISGMGSETPAMKEPTEKLK